MKNVILTEEMFNAYATNIQLAARGEKTMYSRCLAAIQARERWLKTRVLGAEIMEKLEDLEDLEDLDDLGNIEILYGYVTRVIFNIVMWEMLPQLDIVLTPNGAGVVNSGSIAPASAERVNALRVNYMTQYNFNFAEMYKHLQNNIKIWKDSAPAKQFAKLLLSPVDFYTADFELAHGQRPWDIMAVYDAWASQAAQLENVLGEGLISKPVLASLRAWNLERTADEEYKADIVDAVKRYEVQILKNMPHKMRDEGSVKAAIFNSPYKAEWILTSQGKAYIAARFANAQNSGGYFW